MAGPENFTGPQKLAGAKAPPGPTPGPGGP